MERNRVEELFLASAQLAGPERAAFLDAACGRDTNLRAEVERLLLHDSDDSFLERPVAAPPLAGQPVQPLQVGPYRIVGILGEGGMGTVYVAEQTEPVQRRVALKVVKLGMDTKQVLARFEQERQALAMMDHPNIAKVFDAGATSEGQPFFVMELVQGVPITTYCEERTLAVPARLALFRQVCHGVQHAHLKGVIHRDLKPSNVLVAERDEIPFCKIIDFGLARATDAKLTEHTFLTERHQILGTPEYMSPEQAGVGPSDIDTRTDVYSLGVLLFGFLTGELPFGSAELRSAGILEILRKLKEDVPAKPSTRVASVGAGAIASGKQLRGDLDWITMRALEKDRTRRYQTPSELAEDLRRHLQHEPVQAGPPSAAYRLRKLVRRYRVQFLAAALVLGAVTVGGVGTLMQYLRAQEYAQSAKVSLDRFHMLSDVVKLREARVSEQALYPAIPAMVEKMQRWLEMEARPLAQRIPIVRAARDEVLSRALATVPAASRPSSASASQASALLPSDYPERFLLETLTALVTDLESFAGAKGELQAVEARLSDAETITKRSIGDHRAEWDKTILAIARSDDVVASKLYAGLQISPQIGLVPIGMDGDSKLWEFAHLPSGEVAKRRARDDKMIIKDDTGIVFVLLPGGEFWMGAQRNDPTGHNYDPQAIPEDESPPHVVTLAPFFLSKYEMTQGQWMRLSRGNNPSYYAPSRSNSRTLRHPVDQVDWGMCDTLMERHGLCLPTEAQWEYGCRAETATPWWSGRERESLRTPKLVANLADQAAKRLGASFAAIEEWPELDDGHALHAPVGSFAANAFGLYDVHGNVWEWCRDWRLDYGRAVQARDGLRLGNSSGDRVDRGGGFVHAARLARSSNRSGHPPTFRYGDLGLRPARDITP